VARVGVSLASRVGKTLIAAYRQTRYMMSAILKKGLREFTVDTMRSTRFKSNTASKTSVIFM
jgi:hypothetical protein